METSADGARRKRRWLAPLLVVAAVAVMAPVVQELPSERLVELRFDHPERIDRVVMTWMDGDEVVQRTELNEPSRSAAPLRTRLQAKNGSYLLELTVVRGGAVETSRRHVVFDGDTDNVTIPIR